MGTYLPLGSLELRVKEDIGSKGFMQRYQYLALFARVQHIDRGTYFRMCKLHDLSGLARRVLIENGY